MGLAFGRVRLAHARRPDLAPIEVEALVDTGLARLCVPQHVAAQRDLEELETREATLAGGSGRLIPYVGPVAISFANRRCFTGAMVLGDAPLLGAIPMEDMDLIVNPRSQAIEVTTANPHFAGAIAKGVRR